MIWKITRKINFQIKISKSVVASIETILYSAYSSIQFKGSDTSNKGTIGKSVELVTNLFEYIQYPAKLFLNISATYGQKRRRC